MGEGGQGETTREEGGALWLPHTIGLDHHKVLLLKRHAQTVCVGRSCDVKSNEDVTSNKEMSA